MSVLEIAQQYVAAGLSVIPVLADGTKAPCLDAGNAVLGRKRRAKPEEIVKWFTPDKEYGDVGIGVQGGAPSLNLGILDFEFASEFEQWCVLVEGEIPGLVARLPVVRTPGRDEAGGRHVYGRGPSAIKTGKLAQMTAEEAVERTGDKTKRTLIEVRGEGAYAVAPGSPAACHTTGRLYQHIGGPALTAVPTLTTEEMDVLLSCAAALNRKAEKTTEGPASARPSSNGHAHSGSGQGLKPGADFNRRASWDDVLTPHGWRQVWHSGGGVGYWRRPGKESGISATTGHCKTDGSGELLYVFSSNANPLEAERGYSKFGAYGVLSHSGDFAAATRELGKSGYGDPPKRQTAPETPAMEEDVEPIEEPTDLDVPAFPLAAFPPELAQYCQEVATSVSCPVDFPAVAMIAVAACAIGASRAISIRRTWTEAPRFYFAIVADPGGGKTPAVDLVTAPLTELQTELHAEWQAANATYKEAVEEYENVRKQASARRKPGGPAVVVPPRPIEPIYQHLYTSNATTESLMPMLAENPRGFMILKDEIASLVLELNQYRSGKGADRQFFLSAWSGVPLKTDRKGTRKDGPLVVPKPFLGIFGGIQPEMLSQLADERGREDGFVHRFLPSYPEESGWPEKIGNAVSVEAEAMWRQVFTWLLNALKMKDGGDGASKAHVLYLDEQAVMVADDWWAAHARERNAEDFSPQLCGPWSKMRMYLFRFAVVIHCMRQACGEIHPEPDVKVDADTMLAAIALVDYFKGHIRRVYPHLNSTADDRQAVRVVGWIKRRGGTATPRDLVRMHLCKKASEAHDILKDLVDRGWGKFTEVTNAKGKKHSVFRLSSASEEDETVA